MGKISPQIRLAILQRVARSKRLRLDQDIMADADKLFAVLDGMNLFDQASRKALAPVEVSSEITTEVTTEEDYSNQYEPVKEQTFQGFQIAVKRIKGIVQTYPQKRVKSKVKTIYVGRVFDPAIAQAKLAKFYESHSFP